ncbi:MAG TPA: 2-hydroxyglutaryl-CoA dehydratase [Gammaproteobacteria bacterium]
MPHAQMKQLLDFEEIETRVRVFEAAERRRLGLDEPAQWREGESAPFLGSQRPHTTVLFGGLTVMQDRLIEAALAHLGYRVEALACPDNNALQLGKEFGNRAQCNPTYYTVGNLIKYLNRLRDEQQLTEQQIVERYVFITAGGCGPCRFGMYSTEYRKALRDAGYDGFRVTLFQQSTDLRQGCEEAGLALTPKFFISIVKAVMAGDVLNLIGYRMRPYEVVPHSVDKALDECRQIVSEALVNGKGVLKALRRCRTRLAQIELDHLQAKPKVSVIGEFWAMTTEGDGNYHLQRFLEKEGAEVEIQPITNWLLYSLWEIIYDNRREMRLSRERDLLETERKRSRLNFAPIGKELKIRLLRKVVTVSFYRFAKAVGLNDYHLTDQDDLAKKSHSYYLNELRGGEGHMEVGKLIQAFEKRKAHLVLSVKPFGCMPSSAVSDGVQSLVTAHYPQANFLPIETSGDGAVNVYSRVQMALFKVRQKARDELEQALTECGLTLDAVRQRLAQRRGNTPRYPEHREACTAANAVYELS